MMHSFVMDETRDVEKFMIKFDSERLHKVYYNDAVEELQIKKH